MNETSLQRLSRLLLMVPWLLAHPGVSLTEAADEFKVSQAQIVKDLELLFVCGLPGHLPDDLIDANWDTGLIYVSNADAISRPLRLAVDEACALILGLEALAQVPGIGERQAVSRALAKLTETAGAAASAAGQIRVELLHDLSPHVLAAVNQALAAGRRLQLEYLVPHRDQTTLRDVDPMTVGQVDGHWYLRGWCYLAESERTFRLDRVVQVTVLNVAALAPVNPQRDLADHVFAPDPGGQLVELSLSAAGRWVADYYRIEEAIEQPDGRLLVRLRTADLGWVRALVLRLGGAGVVVTPPELAREVRELAAAALAAYSDPEPVPGPTDRVTAIP